MVFENFVIPETNKDLLEGFYKEIVEEFEYDRFGIKVEPEDIVVDCGANIGIFSRYAADIMGASKVYSFELLPSWFKYLDINTFNHPKITTCLGNVSPEDWSLQKIIETYKLYYIDFLKLDIEGGEFGYIVETPDHILHRIRKMAIEIHMSTSPDGHWLLLMLEKLSKCGFDVKVEWIHKEWDVAMVYAKRNFLIIK